IPPPPTLPLFPTRRSSDLSRRILGDDLGDAARRDGGGRGFVWADVAGAGEVAEGGGERLRGRRERSRGDVFGGFVRSGARFGRDGCGCGDGLGGWGSRGRSRRFRWRHRRGRSDRFWNCFGLV